MVGPTGISAGKSRTKLATQIILDIRDGWSAENSNEIHIDAFNKALCNCGGAMASHHLAAVSAIFLDDSTDDAIQTASATRRETRF